MTAPKILFCGDNHSHFRHIIKAVEDEKPDAIVLLGDIEPGRSLEIELVPILGKIEVRFIHGNHDTDTDFNVRNLFGSTLADRNLDGQVVDVAGVRIAGLGGAFRGRVWMPPAAPIFDSYTSWMRSAKPPHGVIDVAFESQARTHRSTIFPDVFNRLSMLEADVLVVHEAPSCHPHGFEAIDDLAQALGVTTVFHGHHHDRLDYSSRFGALGFEAYGVGYCGITDLDGRAVRAGEFDEDRAHRQENMR